MRRALLAMVCVAAGCGDAFVKIDSSDGGTVETSQVAPPPAPPDAGTCASPAADEEDAAFVQAGSAVPADLCGARRLPCPTIAAAIDRGKTTIHVARGVYAETLHLREGLRIEGGWDGGWKKLCRDARSAVVIEGTVTVEAKDVTLATLTVKSGAGRSRYGVIARGSATKLRLDDVEVIAERGANGADGATGTIGADGALCPAGGDGASATLPGANGPAAEVGTFDESGYVPRAGARGADGERGHDGRVATAGSCVRCGSCSGTASLCSFQPGALSCGTAGVPGCGGEGGRGGAPGEGGGSSVALFVWDAKVIVTGGSLRASDAGEGGRGGEGGAGGAGGTGTSGAPGGSCVTACGGLACGGTFGAGGAGGDAGAGGRGSDGGRGGDGASGWSFAVLRGGSTASVTIAGATLAHGKGARSGDEFTWR